MARRLVQNPAWATKVLTTSWAAIAEHVKPAWLPIIDSVQYAERGLIQGEIHEYGCGAYGCVYPTHDEAVVLKITADSTEAEFAAMLAPGISAPICVTYHAVMQLAGKHRDAQTMSTLYLLWRESARHVGDMAALGPSAVELIWQQHTAAQAAYEVIKKQEDPWLIDQYIQHWLAACSNMTADQTIASLGQGMVDTYHRNHIFFGDIHAGNVGLVTRAHGDMWVITDPGHVAVINGDPQEQVHTIRESAGSRSMTQRSSRRSAR